MNKVTQSIYKKKVDNLEETAGGSKLEDIVDTHGNKRFIEGTGNPATIAGMTITYNKWSLSGTHLMMVVCGTFEQNVAALAEIISYNLPEWILNKIVALSPYGEINRYNPIYYYEGGTAYTRSAILNKDSNGLSFVQGNLIDVTSGKVFFRVQFDLLIDSE